MVAAATCGVDCPRAHSPVHSCTATAARHTCAMKPLSALDWNDLRYFLSAARARTLAGAARELGVDHATIGRRLAALERAIGAPLFVRSATGLVPTPLGDELAPLV